MLPILELLVKVFDNTIYGEVVKAMTDPGYAKSVIKRLTEQRKLAFAILGAIVAFYVKQGQLTAAANVIVFVLLCSYISSTYDGINEDTYKAYVQSVGPATFTFVNVLPIIVSQGLLCIEIIATYQSKPAAVVVLLLVTLPGLLQVIAGCLKGTRERTSTEA